MILLQNGDSRVLKIIQKDGLNARRRYRLSRWVCCYDMNDSIVLRSSLSKQIYRLSQEEWDAVKQGDDSSQTTAELARQRFLVEEDFDDLAQYQMVTAVLRSLERNSGKSQFTILPTTGCNARCVYCYQQGIAVNSMTPDTADRVSDYICRVKDRDAVSLHWFGGEPLCSPGIISRICHRLGEEGVEYTSSITTNGSLFTRELIKEAVEVWHLEKAQVSMDGDKADYEIRKQYIRPDLYNYDVVMENIRLLADEGIKVTIRSNCDMDNISEVYRFIDDCADRFLGTGNVHLVPAMLKQDKTAQGKDIRVSSLFVPLIEYADKAGFTQKKGFSTRLATNHCMADSGGSHIIIDPLGDLYVCDNEVGRKSLGSIFDSTPPHGR